MSFVLYWDVFCYCIVFERWFAPKCFYFFLQVSLVTKLRFLMPQGNPSEDRVMFASKCLTSYKAFCVFSKVPAPRRGYFHQNNRSWQHLFYKFFLHIPGFFSLQNLGTFWSQMFCVTVLFSLYGLSVFFSVLSVTPCRGFCGLILVGFMSAVHLLYIILSVPFFTENRSVTVCRPKHISQRLNICV